MHHVQRPCPTRTEAELMQQVQLRGQLLYCQSAGQRACLQPSASYCSVSGDSAEITPHPIALLRALLLHSKLSFGFSFNGILCQGWISRGSNLWVCA